VRRSIGKVFNVGAGIRAERSAYQTYFGTAVLSCVVAKVKLSLCLTNYALRHEDIWGGGVGGMYITTYS
jgi:hypothetical protein